MLDATEIHPLIDVLVEINRPLPLVRSQPLEHLPLLIYALPCFYTRKRHLKISVQNKMLTAAMFAIDLPLISDNVFQNYQFWNTLNQLQFHFQNL